MSLEQAFGDTLRQLRNRAGLSQEKLAFRCDLDRTYISLLERGLRQPSLNTIFSIANAVDIKPESLIKRVRVANE